MIEKIYLQGEKAPSDPNGLFINSRVDDRLADKMNEIIDWINEQEKQKHDKIIDFRKEREINNE